MARSLQPPKILAMNDKPTRIRLKGDIWLVPGRRKGHYPHCNSLFIDSGERAVIDPGSNRRELRRIAEEGVGVALLSHHHSDHVRDLKEFPGVRTYVHEIEKEAVESFEGTTPLNWFPEEEVDPIWKRRKEREVGGWGWPVAGTFKDGDEIPIGEVRVVVIHTPGHTPGHCCFWFPRERLLYSADIDLTEFGPWYGNAKSSAVDFMDSINRVMDLDPQVIVTGHEAGVINSDFRDRLKVYASVLEDRHKRVLDFLDKPRSVDEITKQGFIYGTYYSSDNSIHLPEWRMVRHHLAMAIEHGEVEKAGDEYLATGRGMRG